MPPLFVPALPLVEALRSNWNGHMAKEKTKQLGWYTTWINICLVWFLKEMQNWLMNIGFREAWQELFVLPRISWRTLISIPKVVAGGDQGTHPCWSQRQPHNYQASGPRWFDQRRFFSMFSLLLGVEKNLFARIFAFGWLYYRAIKNQRLPMLTLLPGCTRIYFPPQNISQKVFISIPDQ